VLTQFKHERKRLMEAIPGAKLFHERDMADWKAGKIPVWIADPRSMSHGIDGMQHGGRIAVWFTLTYSNETYIQTNARLVRTGQSYETIIYRLIAADTVDEAVVEALREKGDQQHGLFTALRNLQLMEKANKKKAA
jgi:SNF2 family DNA or RNA helicase